MNEQQRSTLIKLVHQVQAKPSDFTIQSVGHLDKTWEYARTFRGLEVCHILYQVINNDVHGHFV